MRNQFIIIISFIFIISGCKKELGVFLLNEMKNENPYTGSETLKYLDNNGDTIIFHGNGRYTEEFHSEVDYGRNGKYFVNELDRCSFTDEENNNELFIQLTSNTVKFNTYHQRETTTGYMIDVKVTDHSGENTKGCDSYVTIVPIPIIDFKDSNFFYDSLLVNNIYYYDVISFSDNSFLLHYGDCNERLRAETIYYCTSDGIIKIAFENDTTWNLLNIEQ